MAVSRTPSRLRGTINPLTRIGEPQPAAITSDRLTVESLDAPDAEAPGESFTVRATISCQAPLFTNCEAAARFSFGGDVRRVPSGGFQDIGEGTQQTFEATFTMTETSGPVTVEALESGPGGVNVEDQASSSIESITQGQKVQRDVISFVPWAVGGGAIGGGAAQLTGRSAVAGGAAGVGAGVATKVVANQIGGIPNLGQIIPEFPTTAVLATAGLLGAAGVLLWVTPLDEVIFGQNVGGATRA